MNVKGVAQVFTPEQVLAFYFRKIKKFYEHAGIANNDLVISVPSYFSNVER